ncbi:MAG: TonB family protein [Gemmatimonadota bacterium]|nr:TonB family protein [Gemmatimonadota bacterium]
MRAPGQLISRAFASLAVLAALLSPLRGSRLRAQANEASATIAGVVHDSLGAGLAGAEIAVPGTALLARSDGGGAFSLRNVPPGTVSLRVRRLGYHPLTVELAAAAREDASVRVTMARLAQDLAPVVVRGVRGRYTGPFAEFHRRREAGFGHFITRSEIERRNPIRLTDLLRHVPGIRISATRSISNAVRIRNSRCAPIVWLDGTPLTMPEFDLDALTPSTIEGLEVYSGVSTVPPQFMGPRGQGSCGAIVVWSRRGEPRPRAGRPLDLRQLVAALEVFTAEQVDVPARPDSTAPAAPVYPDSLRDARVSGSVLAEFVVDTAGEVELETFGTVSSTHPLFTEAVRRALGGARFHPAVRAGRVVRQVVQLPFRFVAEERSGG